MNLPSASIRLVLSMWCKAVVFRMHYTLCSSHYPRRLHIPIDQNTEFVEGLKANSIFIFHNEINLESKNGIYLNKMFGQLQINHYDCESMSYQSDVGVNTGNQSEGTRMRSWSPPIYICNFNFISLPYSVIDRLDLVGFLQVRKKGIVSQLILCVRVWLCQFGCFVRRQKEGDLTISSTNTSTHTPHI